MLGFSLRRGRLLLKRRRAAAFRLFFVALCAYFTALLAAEWRAEMREEAKQAAASFPILAVFPTAADSADAHFTARQFGALYYVDSSAITSASEAWEKMSETAGNLASVLGGNPFPAVARVTLQPEYCTPDVIAEAVAEMRRIAPECEIISDPALAARATARVEYLDTSATAGIIAAAALITLLIYFTLRAEHLRDPDEARALTAMGAGRLFMALPHAFFAVYSGIMAAAAAAVFRLAAEFLPLYPLRASLADSATLIAAVYALYFFLSVATSFGLRR